MKRKNQINKKINNKKGFSLLELLCAVMIMAIAVSATATGLAISYQSITKNTLMNKASAKAQMYCDVIMTYVEKTPSDDPNESWTSRDTSENKLFAMQPNTTYRLTNDVTNKIKTDVAALDASMTDAKQYDSSSINSRAFNASEVAYVIDREGSYTTNAGVEMASYKITVYVNYGTNGIVNCTGIVTKPKFSK